MIVVVLLHTGGTFASFFGTQSNMYYKITYLTDKTDTTDIEYQS